MRGLALLFSSLTALPAIPVAAQDAPGKLNPVITAVDFAPDTGASGTSPCGGCSLTVMSDERGREAATGGALNATHSGGGSSATIPSGPSLVTIAPGPGTVGPPR